MKKTGLALMLFILGVFLTTPSQAIEFDEFGAIDIHAFISQGFLKSDGNNFFADTEDGTFQFNEMGINFATDITSELRLGVQFFARDLGRLNNDEVMVDWAYADYRYSNLLGLRVGKTKTPMGLYNKVRDIDMLRTTIILPQSIYNEAWRDLIASSTGAQLYGFIPAGFLGSFQYQGQLGIVNMGKDIGTSETMVDNIPAPIRVKTLNNEVKHFNSGGLEWNTPIPGLRLSQTIYDMKFYSNVQHTRSVGAKVNPDPANPTPLTDSRGNFILLDWQESGDQVTLTNLITGESAQTDQLMDVTIDDTTYKVAIVDDALNPYAGAYGRVATAGANDRIMVETTNFTSSLEFTYNNLVTAFEWSRVRYNIKLGKDLPAETIYTLGYYGSLSYRFDEYLELGFYYSEFYRDDDDKDGKKAWQGAQSGDFRTWLKDYCFTVRIDLSMNWIFKLEAHRMNGAAWMFDRDNLDDRSMPDFEQDWNLFAAKMTYSF